MQLCGFSSLLTREITLKKPLREAEDTHRLFQMSSPKIKTEATSEMWKLALTSDMKAPTTKLNIKQS